MQDEREGELEPNVRQLQKKRGSLPMYSPLNLNQVLSMLCNKKKCVGIAKLCAYVRAVYFTVTNNLNFL
jgi:hypothetical protein